METEKIMLVSGGNRGMGLETCRRLALLGHRVLLGSRDPQAGQRAAESLGNLEVQAVKLDVARQADIDALALLIDAQYGRLDVLVNNAGILIDSSGDKSTSICDADLEDLQRSIDINTFGPIRLINAVLPLMAQVDDARIINISSGMGQLSEMGGNYPGYRISKTGLNALTRIYAAELDPGKFSINSVCPGWVRTEMGGAGADLPVEEGVDTAIWLATSKAGRRSGGFYRKREVIDW